MNRQKKRKEELKIKFIKCGKEMIKESGIDNFSLRKLADHIGYSYTTIYNYFSSMDEYLWYVSLTFIEELVEVISISGENSCDNINLFLEKIESYYRYYFENPNVFKFLFFYPLEMPSKDIKEEFEKPVLWNILLKGLYDYFDDEDNAESKIENIGNIIVSVIHGKLLFYFSKKEEIGKEEIIIETKQNIEFLLSVEKN